MGTPPMPPFFRAPRALGISPPFAAPHPQQGCVGGLAAHRGSCQRVGRRGEQRGVALRSGLEGAEELEVEVGVEVELGLELELELGVPAAVHVDVGEAVHKSFLKPVHNSSIRKCIIIHL